MSQQKARHVRCPFCFWNRIENTDKGAEPFNEDAAMIELVAHMQIEHYILVERLLSMFNEPEL